MAAGMNRRITRGELAQRTGVNSETIRYFERIGILAAPERTEGGHRIYDEGHVRTLGFIRRARNLGFTPDEVINLFGLAIRHRLTADDLKQTIFAYPTGASDIGYML